MNNPKPPPEDDPEEIDHIHAEIQRDIRNGNGARHFEDVLDELHSTHLRSDPIEQVRIERRRSAEFREFLGALKTSLSASLLPQGLKCEYVEIDDDDLTVCARDKEKRQHEVKVPLELLNEYADAHPSDPRAVMTHVVDRCMRAVFRARDAYFRRRDAMQ